jgi:hypothetical protein
MNRRRFVLIVLSIALAFTGGCKSEAVRPDLKRSESVETVVLINVPGLAPLLLPAMNQMHALPTIQRMGEEGVTGQLNGGVPVAFAGATTSILTGKDPKEHGVDYWFFLDEEKNILRGYESGHIRVKTLPQMLAMRGISTLNVFWPVTHPALPDAGDMVSPGPIPDRNRIDDYAFVPDLSPVLPGRCKPEALCSQVESILAAHPSREEIFSRFSLPDDFSDPFAKAMAADLIQGYLADMAAMEIAETLWRDEHRLIAVNLVGADLLGRRLYGQFDPRNFKIGKEEFTSFGKILVAYYRFIDGFVRKVEQRVGEKGVVILISDHGMGPAPPVDSNRRLFPGRPHPVGLFVAYGAGVRVGGRDERLMPYHLTALVLNLLGQPIPKDGKQNINGRILAGDRFVIQSAPSVPTYENGRHNPSPSAPFGERIGGQERYSRYGELPPPLAH